MYQDRRRLHISKPVVIATTIAIAVLSAVSAPSVVLCIDATRTVHEQAVTLRADDRGYQTLATMERGEKISGLPQPIRDRLRASLQRD